MVLRKDQRNKFTDEKQKPGNGAAKKPAGRGRARGRGRGQGRGGRGKKASKNDDSSEPDTLHYTQEDEDMEESADDAADPKPIKRKAKPGKRGPAKQSPKKGNGRVMKKPAKRKGKQPKQAARGNPKKRRSQPSEDEAPQKRTTFAGRRRPQGEDPGHRFDALEAAFKLYLFPQLGCLSLWEVRMHFLLYLVNCCIRAPHLQNAFWNFAINSLRERGVVSQAYDSIAKKQAQRFLKDERGY